MGEEAIKWTCPACKMRLNCAPYRKDELDPDRNQAVQHLKGNRHKKAMQAVWDQVMTTNYLVDFFKEMGRPDLVSDSADALPMDMIKNYVKECGGNPEETIRHFMPPPPPDASQHRRSPEKKVTRLIDSPIWATSTREGKPVKTRLLIMLLR